MFNFFDEIKKSVGLENDVLAYNLVNVGGKILYVEGHQGLTILSKEMIAFKVRRARVTVEGKDLKLFELTDSTMKIVGQIGKVEVV